MQKRKYFRKILVFLLLLLVMYLILRYKNPYSNVFLQSQFSNLTKAHTELDSEVRSAVAILISRDYSRNGSYYQIHIIKNKHTDFFPVALRSPRNDGRIAMLRSQPHLTCIPAHGKALSTDGLREFEAPYALYQSGNYVAFETEWLTSSNAPLYDTDARFDLIIDTKRGSFYVPDLEINDICRTTSE